eukprot:7204160-Prymnesium_polylepis.1
MGSTLHEAVLKGRAAVGAHLQGGAAMLSGASDGADTLFGALAMQCNHKVVHFLGPRNSPSKIATESQPGTLYRVGDDTLESEQVNRIVDSIRQVRYSRQYPSREAFEADWRDSRRNVLQVSAADA